MSAASKAQNLAEKAHRGQKYGNGPYTDHLDEVVRALKSGGYGDEASRAAAYLHDVLEDTATTSEELLAAGFDSDVVKAVEFCSDEEGPNRKTRKHLTYARMASLRDALVATASPWEYKYVVLGIQVKVADRLANAERSWQGAYLGSQRSRNLMKIVRQGVRSLQGGPLRQGRVRLPLGPPGSLLRRSPALTKCHAGGVKVPCRGGESAPPGRVTQ